MLLCDKAAASSALTEDDDSEYLHASVSGIGKRYRNLHVLGFFSCRGFFFFFLKIDLMVSMVQSSK